MTDLRNVKKACLIIPCSDRKSTSPGQAHEIYKGVLMDIIKSFDLSDVFAHFELYFLSAKYGLISANHHVIPYCHRMPSSNSKLASFALLHRESAQSLLKQSLDRCDELFTVLSKDYQSAFELMALKSVGDFKMVYQSTNARGIGDHRARLKKIILSKLTKPIPPVLYRSGCTSETEFLGYKNAGQAVGASLAYFNRKGVLRHVVDSVKHKIPTFCDNGLITAVNNGKDISAKDVFDEYFALVRSINGSGSLSIVVPDDPFDQNKALGVIKTFKKEIKLLSKQCNVIIVMHKPVIRSLTEQAKIIMDILGNVRVTLGVPCRKVAGHNWRLSVSEIESLFQMKKSDKTPLFSKVHFLALSETTRGKVYQERLTLAHMYNVEFFADASRTCALFGHENSTRKGSIQARLVKVQIAKDNTLRSVEYLDYDGESEIDSTNIFDKVSALTSYEKGALWNACYPICKIDIETDTDDEIEEAFDNLTSAYFHEFISKAKEVYYSMFTQPKHEPSFSEVRSHAITRCFNTESQTVPVQQVMGF